MPSIEQAAVHYLSESRSSELAVVDSLRSHIAVAPRGAHRRTLESHARRSADHVRRIEARLRELGDRPGLVSLGTAVVGAAVERAVAFGLAPLRVGRGSGGRHVLENSVDACAHRSRAVASHTALERVADTLEDPNTAGLAATLRARQEEMLGEAMDELPHLASIVVGWEVYGEPTYEVALSEDSDRTRDGRRSRRDAARTSGGNSQRADSRRRGRRPLDSHERAHKRGGAVLEAVECESPQSDSPA
jgi:hypothetical protein